MLEPRRQSYLEYVYGTFAVKEQVGEFYTQLRGPAEHSIQHQHSRDPLA